MSALCFPNSVTEVELSARSDVNVIRRVKQADGREYAVIEVTPGVCWKAGCISLRILGTPIVFAVSAAGALSFGCLCDCALHSMVPLEEKVARGIRRTQGKEDESLKCFKWWCGLNSRFAGYCAEITDKPQEHRVEVVEEKPAITKQPTRDAAVLQLAKDTDPLLESLLTADLYSLPPTAFGKAKWLQYFGEIVEEPPLPPDIHKILQGPCPFWPDKKVAETHFLTLIPENMTLERLESLTQNPKQGNKIGFCDKDNTSVQSALNQHGKTPSRRAHWVLMTNDVIPGSQFKSWKNQQALAAKFKGRGYALLSGIDAATCLLVEYVETGRGFYTDMNLTRCVELVENGPFQQWPLLIGGFKSGGVGVTISPGEGLVPYGVGVARKFL